MSDTQSNEPTPDEPTNDAENVPEEATEAGSDQVKSVLEEEQEKGYRGTPTDKTPNEAYTVVGVTSGADTPEAKAFRGETE